MANELGLRNVAFEVDDLQAVVDQLLAFRETTGDFGVDDAALLPDLGPGAVMDQLTVLVYETCSRGGPDGSGAQALPGRLRDLLAAL